MHLGDHILPSYRPAPPPFRRRLHPPREKWAVASPGTARAPYRNRWRKHCPKNPTSAAFFLKWCDDALGVVTLQHGRGAFGDIRVGNHCVQLIEVSDDPEVVAGKFRMVDK